MLKTLVLFAFAIFIALALLGGWTRPTLGQATARVSPSPVARLGERLFRDERFSAPNGDLTASCSNCHLFDEDPQGVRAFTDFFIKSWVASRPQDPRRLMLRNSPTLLDAGAMPQLHYDGEFNSLEELARGTIAGRPMGWLPEEEQQGLAHAQAVVLNDAGEGAAGAVTYRQQFQKAFAVDLATLNPEQTVNLIAKAIAEFCRTLTTRKDSPYDQFIAANRLARRTAPNETDSAYAVRLLAAVEKLESRGALKFSRGFDRAALQGMKVFLRADRGNCVSCHAPPQFTNHRFHNLGISQREYDQVHGEGRFAALAIPGGADAHRPTPQFREPATKARPGEVDLGYWNFVNFQNSPMRRADESDERLLQRMIATFKTPTLRNLRYTQPYFHNGSLHTLEEVLSEIMLLSEMARAGKLREADEELAKIKLTSADLAPLLAFLNSLNEDLKKSSFFQQGIAHR